jgi:hypothetical protein
VPNVSQAQGVVQREEITTSAAGDGSAQPAVVFSFGDVEAATASRAQVDQRVVHPWNYGLLVKFSLWVKNFGINLASSDSALYNLSTYFDRVCRETVDQFFKSNN